MSKARKLPSGSWQTRATRTINGKKVTRAFTVSPQETKGDSRKAKALSEMQARSWQLETDSAATYGKNVEQALNDFVDDREKVLSPSTITNYRRIIPLFEPILDIYIDDIETSHIQRIINDWSISVKAKTIKNRISFLLSALYYAECNKRFRLRYPLSESKTILSPDLKDVQLLINLADEDFKPVLYLAAFGGMRRGEIAALKQQDISRDMNTILIHADMVLDGHSWKYKPFTKTAASGTIQLPKFIIESLPVSDNLEDFVFSFNPNVITHKYDKLKKKAGLDYNFHSLRHFAASFRSDLNIPSKYIEEVGRWKNSKVLHQIYDNTLTSSRKKYNQLANEYIEKNFKVAD